MEFDIEEEKELILLAKGGDTSAYKKILTKLQPLVESIANRYYKNEGGIPKGELISLGNRGLEAAFKHFDTKKSYRFSTYATWWIRQAIHRELGIEDDD